MIKRVQIILLVLFISYYNCILAENDEFVPTKEWQVVKKEMEDKGIVLNDYNYEYETNEADYSEVNEEEDVGFFEDDFIRLINAVRNNNLEIVQDVVNTPYVDVNQKTPNGFTPLLLAIFRQHLAIVELLLIYGEDPNLKEGQKIPQGLHIRMDLTTGQTEAKLLNNDEEQQDTKLNALVSVPTESDLNEPISQSDLKKKLINIHTDNEVLSKDDRNTIKTQFRNYDEIKKSLGELNLTPKLDWEIIQELLTEHKQLWKQATLEIDKLLRVLEDLNFLAHQYDNAIEFVKQDGFVNVIYKNLNHTSDGLKAATFVLLTTLTQNNNKPKIHALETGALQIILKNLINDKNSIVRSRALSALSSLLRNFPVAQQNFIKMGGFNLLINIFDTTDIKSQIKVVTMLSDMVTEFNYAKSDQNLYGYYLNIDWNAHILEYKWCDNLNKLLIRLFQVDKDNHDSIEKSLIAMNAVKDSCGLAYKRNLLINIRSYYSNLIINESDNEDNHINHYFKTLKSFCDEILDYINYKQKIEL